MVRVNGMRPGPRANRCTWPGCKAPGHGKNRLCSPHAHIIETTPRAELFDMVEKAERALPDAERFPGKRVVRVPFEVVDIPTMRLWCTCGQEMGSNDHEVVGRASLALKMGGETTSTVCPKCGAAVVPEARLVGGAPAAVLGMLDAAAKKRARPR